MFSENYYDNVIELLSIIHDQELGKMELAGEKLASSIENNGLMHVFGCGHSHMLSEELFYRAGGLVAVNPIFEESVMLHGGAAKSSKIERMTGYAQYVLDNYEIKKGDIFLISSSSGINPFPVEMAEGARERGAFVIGITSMAYREQKSRDKRGLHLFDVCDLVIDNHVPFGDASVEIMDSGVKAGPLSSIACFYIANSIILAACQILEQNGETAPVFISGNIDGGDIHNENLLKRYSGRIKHL